jgi:hypothetical protein
MSGRNESIRSPTHLHIVLSAFPFVPNMHCGPMLTGKWVSGDEVEQTMMIKTQGQLHRVMEGSRKETNVLGRSRGCEVQLFVSALR